MIQKFHKIIIVKKTNKLFQHGKYISKYIYRNKNEND